MKRTHLFLALLLALPFTGTLHAETVLFENVRIFTPGFIDLHPWGVGANAGRIVKGPEGS